jgi:hypothetical protein
LLSTNLDSEIVHRSDRTTLVRFDLSGEKKGVADDETRIRMSWGAGGGWLDHGVAIQLRGHPGWSRQGHAVIS